MNQWRHGHVGEAGEVVGSGFVNAALGQFEHCLVSDLVVGFFIFVVCGGGGFRGCGDGWLMVVVADVGLWCRGGGGQRAVGMVMADVGLIIF